MKTNYVIPFFIPHRGCPFTCVFCGQNKITGQKSGVDPKTIAERVKQCLSTIPKGDNHIEVGFFGGSFTGLDRSEQFSYLKEVTPFLDTGRIRGIRISTRPDYIDQEIIDFLKENYVKVVELGVQSMDNDVLKASGRGHTLDDIKLASEIIIQNGLSLGHQIMVGLPGSTMETEIFTAELSVKMNPAMVRIYPVAVIKDTPLERMMNTGEYVPLTWPDALHRCSKLLRIYGKNNIEVIRCGLHPSEDLVKEGNVAGGIFHPSFRQKVETYYYSTLLKEIFKEKTASGIKSVLYHPKEAAYVFGHKRENAEFLEKKYLRYGVLRPCVFVPVKSLKVEYKDGNTKIVKDE